MRLCFYMLKFDLKYTICVKFYIFVSLFNTIRIFPMTTEFLILKGLSDILSDVKHPNNRPVFKLVDEFMSQYEDDNENPLWTAPAALIELGDIEWEDDVLNNPVTGTLRFSVHFVDDVGFDDKKRRLNTAHNDNLSKGAGAVRQRRVRFTDFGLTLNNVLINRIQKRRTRFIQTLAETVVTIVDFEATVVDYSMLPIWTEVIVPFIVNHYLVKDELEFLDIINN